MRRLFLTALLTLACAVPSFGQGRAVTLRETSSTIQFYGTVAMGSDSTGTVRTQAVQVGDANQGAGYIRLTTNDATGTETLMIKIEVSHDGITWTASDTLANGISSSTTTTDTLTTLKGNSRLFKTAHYVRLVVKGNATNRAGVTLTYAAILPKNVGADPIRTSRVAF